MCQAPPADLSCGHWWCADNPTSSPTSLRANPDSKNQWANRIRFCFSERYPRILLCAPCYGVGDKSGKRGYRPDRFAIVLLLTPRNCGFLTDASVLETFWASPSNYAPLEYFILQVIVNPPDRSSTDLPILPHFSRLGRDLPRSLLLYPPPN